MAGRKSEIDLPKVETMAARFCKNDEIARELGFDREEFSKRKDVQAAFERGRNAAKIAVRSLLFDVAGSGDRQAIIFLAKNELGYRDYPPDASPVERVPQIVDDVEAGDTDG